MLVSGFIQAFCAHDLCVVCEQTFYLHLSSSTGHVSGMVFPFVLEFTQRLLDLYFLAVGGLCYWQLELGGYLNKRCC